MDRNLGFSNSNTLETVGDVELTQAFTRNEFFLVYQPAINFVTSAFVGVEALVRWRHPTHDVLLPDAFMSRFEAGDLMPTLGQWTLSNACAQAIAWYDKGYRFPVSVNVAVQQFTSPDFVDTVADSLLQSRLDPAMLVLEFAQTSLLSNTTLTLSRLSELRRLGVRVAVDDFVPGTSSFDALVIFNLDFVKLDRRFVSELTDPAGQAASRVHALVRDAKQFPVQIVATGIEDTTQRDQLANEQVRVGQGFLFSKPHEAEDIDELLRNFEIFSGKPL